jgi:uncharacterized protein
VSDTSAGIPGACWLTPSAEVRTSVIEGDGLFATKAIAEGETVIRIGGEAIDDAALAGLSTSGQRYNSVTIGDGVHLLIDPEHPICKGNHSCAPNLWHAEGDVTTVLARRDIAFGEELTQDYGTHTGVERWSMICNCRAATCRGEVTGRDWRRRDLREAYGRRWAGPLLRRIQADEADSPA